jgi:hypothetical protein
VLTLALAAIALGPAEAQRASSGAGRKAPAPAKAAKAAPPAPPSRQPVRANDAPAPGALSPRNANYSIDVRLDPASRTLTGSEILTWRNISGRPATDLQFHLYYNGWRNTGSTWIRESLLVSPGAASDVREADWGWITVTGIKVLPPASAPLDVTSSQRFIAPDDGNQDDRTVLSVPLKDPVDPGETVNVQIDWTSRVPRTFARTGTVGDYYFLAQWFPKIGVLEDAGWNCHQFHAGTEFFADYGTYDVSMTVPRGWVLGATGVERERRDNADGTTTHRYAEEDVHDFAWTTSPHFQERTAAFEHATLPPVKMRLLLQPEHAGQADRHFEATRATLRHYGEWYGAYPYGHITVVDPAWQSGTGGMEYPTLFTAGSRWLAPDRVTQPEGVTVHEAGHQFWYGIVGNNEFEHAWLDEGFNTFSTARTIEAAHFRNHLATRFFGGFVPWVFRDIVLSRDTDGNRLPSYRGAAESDAQATATWRYWPGTGGAITYNKTALWLHMLERQLGWPTLQRILQVFFQRWKFRHPKPADFFAVASEVAGRDLTWFFDEVHRGSNAFDYAIGELSSTPASATGFFEADRGLAFQSRTDGKDQYVTQVVARRQGEAIHPVDVEVTFADGQKVRERWDGRDRWKLFTYTRPSRATQAVIDPDRVVLLDVNMTNNGRTLAPQAAPAARKWTIKWIIWLQDVMLTYAMFI